MTLKEKRTAANMTQLDVAKAVGVTEQAYRQWERGAMNPNEENAKKLEIVLRDGDSIGRTPDVRKDNN